MYKFGSIEQFKNVIAEVRRVANKYGRPVPTLKFQGTVKIHGTNAAVVFPVNGEPYFQSRERVLSLESDNAGFCQWGMKNLDTLRNIFDNVDTSVVPEYDTVVIYGEWCGPGVQKGVGISELDRKIFVVFNITIMSGENRFELDDVAIIEALNRSIIERGEIYCIYDFTTWSVDIDFNAPQLIQNELVNITLQVENECPVAKSLGVSGTGEGVVWWNYEHNLKFKVKGEKHGVSKVKTIKEIAAVDIERMNSMDEFVQTVITENRLDQGLSKLSEMGLEIDIKNTGVFMKWVIGDALKEEQAVIVNSNFDVKELTPKMSAIAKKFWFETLNKVQ